MCPMNIIASLFSGTRLANATQTSHWPHAPQSNRLVQLLLNLFYNSLVHIMYLCQQTWPVIGC